MNIDTQHKINTGLASAMGRHYWGHTLDYAELSTSGKPTAFAQAAKSDLLNWLAKHDQDTITLFHHHLCTLLDLKAKLETAPDWDGASLMKVQCATPAQIAIAAALALGIVTEEDVTG